MTKKLGGYYVSKSYRYGFEVTCTILCYFSHPCEIL